MLIFYKARYIIVINTGKNKTNNNCIMFIIRQDYNIISTNIPVLTNQNNGQFEFKDCYFLEFIIKSDDKTKQKIKTLCKPFVFRFGVRNELSEHIPGNIHRLFLLTDPNIIKNGFENTDDFLAFALCDDNPKNTEIQYFEVNYKFKHSYEPKQKYRRVGTSALNALKEIYKNRELYGKSAQEALKFWLKNDFTLIKEHELYVHWHQK